MTIVDKHIVITGGSSGIGLELVKHLYDRNRISVIARASPGFEALQRSYERITPYEADLSRLDTVESAADLLAKDNQTIDILINNAATQHTPGFLDDDFRYETIRTEIDVNFTSVCILIHLLLPGLLNADHAMIVNINSALGLVPKTSSAVYCATKGALNILSQSLSYQFEHTDIEVKQVFLPLVDTAMTRGRGRGKMSPQDAAIGIIRGMDSSRSEIFIGKSNLLRAIHRVSPGLARRIMKAA